jgi:hypothetical protein
MERYLHFMIFHSIALSISQICGMPSLAIIKRQKLEYFSSIARSSIFSQNSTFPEPEIFTKYFRDLLQGDSVQDRALRIILTRWLFHAR